MGMEIDSAMSGKVSFGSAFDGSVICSKEFGKWKCGTGVFEKNYFFWIKILKINLLVSE